MVKFSGLKEKVYKESLPTFWKYPGSLQDCKDDRLAHHVIDCFHFTDGETETRKSPEDKSPAAGRICSRKPCVSSSSVQPTSVWEKFLEGRMGGKPAKKSVAALCMQKVKAELTRTGSRKANQNERVRETALMPGAVSPAAEYRPHCLQS